MKFLLFLILSACGLVSALGNERSFVHPGLLHTASDFERMGLAVSLEKGPIYEGFKILRDSPYAKSNYALKGPFPEWGRAPNIRKGEAENDALAVYQNALMWAVTGKKEHAAKAIQILNAWRRTLKKVGGIDGVLAAGLQGFMFANAAEILRYTESGWTEAEALLCERWFREVWDPPLEHYAYFANGNWETAALQTRMAIAVYCSDRKMFEETVRYAVAGAGNGSIPHMVVFPSGQCQETTRAQHYAQLGLGLLGCVAEVAWNQGVDLYGWNENRILKGFEYTAQYGLGENVPFQHYLDRTGKYGKGGRNNDYDKISSVSRGSFWPIYERIFNHYSRRRSVPAPYSARVIALKEPEGFNRDHVGLGTLAHRRERKSTPVARSVPGAPSGFVMRSSGRGVKISWVQSVDPLGCSNAETYDLMRSSSPDGPFEVVGPSLKASLHLDAPLKRGQLYYYKATASNKVGRSAPSATIAASAGLPGAWSSSDVGAITVPGFVEYNGDAFSMEGEGHEIGGTADAFHYLYARLEGDGVITARVRRPMSSQWTTPGVMMRESLLPDSRHASVLLHPHWSGGLISRKEKGGETVTGRLEPLGEQYVIKKNRLSAPYWIRLERIGDTFTGSMSPDGSRWQGLGSVRVRMEKAIYLGLPACSQLRGVTTTLTYDRVSTLDWKMPSR